MIITENNFVQQLIDRNSKSLDYMVDNYSNLIYKIVFSVLSSCNDHQCMEECVNDIFLSIWNNIESFNNTKGSFKSWIIAVSKYKSIDYKRKLMKNSDIECIDDYTLSSNDSTENIIISKENKNELLSIIMEMKSIGEIIIKEVKTLQNKTIINYTAEGIAPCFQASNLFLRDEENNPIAHDIFYIEDDSNKPNEFTLAFYNLDTIKKYELAAINLDAYEIREDLKFKIPLEN